VSINTFNLLAELEHRSAEPPVPNLRFVGPVLVRSETNYHVLTLPDRVKVGIGNLAEQDCLDFAAAIRAERPAAGRPDRGLRVDVLGKTDAYTDSAQLKETVRRLSSAFIRRLF
jgi:hypothetical protein